MRSISDPPLPFLLLPDFDGGRGDGYFEEEDGAFDGTSGNGGGGGRDGFVHEGDPLARVPSRASATRAPPQARPRRPTPRPAAPFDKPDAPFDEHSAR